MQSVDLPECCDALSRCDGHVSAGTHGLTVTTFHAMVYGAAGCRRGFEVVHVNLGVLSKGEEAGGQGAGERRGQGFVSNRSNMGKTQSTCINM